MRAQSDLVSMVLISAIVVAAGIALWVFYSGYASAARLSAQEEVNRELSILRSVISADYVLCPQGEALIRNVGKEPVVIFRLLVYRNGEPVWDSLQERGRFRNLAVEIDVGKKSRVEFACPPFYSKDDVITLQVHYAPKSLLDQSTNLVASSPDVMLFQVANFKVEESSLMLAEKACPDETPRWAWIDLVNPEEDPLTGELGNRIGVRLPKAGGVDITDTRDLRINLRVDVRDASGLRSVIAYDVSISEKTQWIEIDMSGLRYPVNITFEALFPEGLSVLQREWYFDAIDTSHINYVRLIWNSLDRKLVGAYVSAFHKIPGTYNVVVRVIDCFGNVVSEGNLTKNIYDIGAAGRWEEYYVTFRVGETMSNIRRIEVYVEDLSAVTIETVVETVTTTETATETITHWVTYPANTKTVFSTTTTTQINTVTATVPTTTTTTTTRIITSYLTTATVTATTTRFITSTSFITVSRTTTTSVATATQTVTSTSTLVTTIPTTTIRYTATATSTTTLTPPPEMRTVTETRTTTVATSTVKATTTVGTTLTSTVTRTATITVCPSSYQQSSLHFVLAALFLAPAFMTSLVMRRCRR